MSGVWQDRDCIEDHDGLILAIRPGDAREFAEDVFACLSDESPLVRKGALAAIGEVATFIGVDRLAPSRAEAIARVVTPVDTAAIACLRRSRCLAALARVDGDWLVENARGLVAHSSPTRLRRSGSRSSRLSHRIRPSIWTSPMRGDRCAKPSKTGYAGRSNRANTAPPIIHADTS